MRTIRHGLLVPCPRDLFGEVPVSLDDVLLWMLAVPQLTPESPRFARYVVDYRVPDKIRAAKIAGTFEATISAATRPAPAVPARLAAAAAAPVPHQARATSR